MSVNDLILLVLVAGAAFYVGYQLGRLKALAEVGAQRQSGADQPLPGPQLDRPYAEPARRGSPPPATAGNDDSWQEAGTAPARRMPPRRSTKPPPAAAGLMGTGDAEKSGGRQK